MKITRKKLLGQIAIYIISILAVLYILKFFTGSGSGLISFIAGFIGVLIAPRLQIKDNNIYLEWGWKKFKNQ